MPSPTGPPNPFRLNVLRWQAGLVLQFPLAGPQGRARQARGLSDEGETASGKAHRFTSGPLPSHPLRHERLKNWIFRPHGFHGTGLTHTIIGVQNACRIAAKMFKLFFYSP